MLSEKIKVELSKYTNKELATLLGRTVRYIQYRKKDGNLTVKEADILLSKRYILIEKR